MSEENMAEEAVTEEALPLEDELGAIFDKANEEEGSGPDRGPDGKFKSREAATEEGAPEGEEIQADEGATVETETAPQPLDPPQSWSAAEKAIWPTLPKEAQEVYLRREADWLKADGERANRMKGYESINAALEPVRQRLALSGIDEGTYIRQLATADEYLRTQPLQAIQWLAQTYGVDLRQLQADQDVDPSVAPFIQKISQLESQLHGLTTQQQAAEQQRVMSAIERFTTDPANKYAQRLETNIIGEIPAVKAMHPHASYEDVLKMAYDRAVRLSDEVQAEIAAERSAEAEAKRKKEAEEKAAKARRIAETNLSSKGTASGSTPPQYKDREEELGAVFDRMQGAA